VVLSSMADAAHAKARQPRPYRDCRKTKHPETIKSWNENIYVI